MTDFYKLTEKTIAKCDGNIDFDMVKSLWRGFTFKMAEIDLSKGDALTFTIGNGELKPLCDEDEFIVNITNEGIGISAIDTPSSFVCIQRANSRIF